MKIKILLTLLTFIITINIKCKSTLASVKVDTCTQKFLNLMQTQWKYNESKKSYLLGEDLENAIKKNIFNNFNIKDKHCLQTLDTSIIKKLCGLNYVKNYYSSLQSKDYSYNYVYRIEGNSLKSKRVDMENIIYPILIIIFTKDGKVFTVGYDFSNREN